MLNRHDEKGGEGEKNYNIISFYGMRSDSCVIGVGGTYTASLYDFSAEGAKTAKCDMRFCAVYQSLWTPKDRT